MKIPHSAVLLNEVKSTFSGLEGEFLDCTLGFGGHSKALLQNCPNLKISACDQDESALEFCKKYLAKFGDRISFFNCNFAEILDKIDTKNLRGILADIGVSSFQLDENERGFSLRSDFLDMRMNKNAKLTAFDIVNFYSLERLSAIFRDFGELKDAKKIAEKICQARAREEIKSAKQLCEIIGNFKVDKRKISKAILVFQALRIEVNNELGVLENLLKKLESLRLENCIFAVICFHSLEDKIVKKYFKKWAKACICDEFAMRCECGKNHALGEIINKKIITPSVEEIKQNSRSSCARMRIFHFKSKE